MDTQRFLPALLLAAFTGLAPAFGADAPDFNDMVGTKATAPRPAPMSTFQRAAEKGHPIPPPAVLERPETVAYTPQTSAPENVAPPVPDQAPPSIEPSSVRMILTEEQVRNFVHDFLAAAQQSTPDDELALYSDSVDYFNRGLVGKRQVQRDQHNYYRRWPSRSFALLGEPEILSMSEDRAVVRYRLQYQLGNGYRVVNGETTNTMVITQTEEGRKIVGIKEGRR